MNRSQLVKAVSGSTSSSRRTVENVVDSLFETIVAEVRSGRKVTVIGFGAFNPTARGPRVGRNPRTGAVVPIPASKGVRFATGSTFKSALNPKEGVSMAVKKAAAKRAVRKAPAKKTAALKATAKKVGNQIDINAEVASQENPGADVRLRLVLVEEKKESFLQAELIIPGASGWRRSPRATPADHSAPP